MKYLTLLTLATVLTYQQAYALGIENKAIAIQPPIAGIHKVADLNGDGYNDIFSSGFIFDYHIYYGFTSPPQPGPISKPAHVLLNNQQGGFIDLEQNINFYSEGLTTFDELNSFHPELADLDNDGDYDILSSEGLIFLNDGKANFSSTQSVGLDSNIDKPVFAIDLNNDTVLEIFIAGKFFQRSNQNPIQYTEITSSVIFDPNLNYSFADFNNDGLIDLLSYGEESDITIYYNQENDYFLETNKKTFTEQEPLKLLVFDVDQDGDSDILLSSRKLLINDSGSFTTKEDVFDFSEITQFIDINDIKKIILHNPINFNDDGYSDIFVTLKIKYETLDFVLTNNQEGVFVAELKTFYSRDFVNGFFSGFQYKTTHLSGDFNNDNRDDFLEFSSYDGVLLRDNTFEFSINPVTNDNEIQLLINNPEGIYLTNFGKIGLQIPHMYNFDNSDSKTILFYSHYSRYNGYALNFRFPFYIKYDASQNLSIHNLSIFNRSASQIFSYRATKPIDYNNDGLDDLYLDKSIVYPNKITSIFLNSENGFDLERKVDIDTNLSSALNTADLNGDGFTDLFIPDSVQSSLVVHVNQQGERSERTSIEMPDLPYSIKVEHLNDDASEDLYYIGIDEKPYVIFGNSDLSLLYKNLILDVEVDIFVANDIDSDNIAELFMVEKESNTIQVYKYNNGEFYLFDSIANYRAIEYLEFHDSTNDGIKDIFAMSKGNTSLGSIKSFATGYSNITFKNFSNENFEIVYSELSDLNSDGSMEIIAITRRDDFSVYSIKDYKVELRVLQLVNNKYISIYKKELFLGSESDYFNVVGLRNNFIFEDFDNDSKTDFLFQGVIYYNRDFIFLPGLNYDEGHNGHGFSLESVGENQFYTVFYTYDRYGNPEWYSDIGVFDIPRDDYWNILNTGIHPIRTQYDYGNQSYVLNNDSLYRGYIRHEHCGSNYGDLTLSFGKNPSFSTNNLIEQINWCSKPLIAPSQRPANHPSGLWWAGEDDSGWGWSMSFVEKENSIDLVVILYYYDGSGNPRWLIGTQENFEFDQQITVNMNSVTGYSRQSETSNLSLKAAGTMQFKIDSSANQMPLVGNMSVNVSYPGAEGGQWTRENIPMYLFSNPRN